MSPDERELLLDAFDSNWIAPLGPHVTAFEDELARYVGVDGAAALSSGTAALHLALLLEGVQPGDVVICPSFTFAATANAVRYVGAEPVFVDSERSTWCVDAELVAEAIECERRRGRKVSAVLSVDLYGLMPDYEHLERVCDTEGVPLVEDAAEALGSCRSGRMAGSFGSSAAFSFNGNKIITTSGGGMLVSDDAERVERARHLATQARQPVPHYEHEEIGYNYRLSNLLAAVGRGQLRHLDERIQQRRANREHYERELASHDQIEFMPAPPEVASNHWLTCLTLRTCVPERIRVHLEHDEVEARPLWKPMHLQPVFSECRYYGNGICDDLFARGLCLPSGSALTPADRERVIQRVQECLDD
jgi:dTDP-4-amino-4,6-dideoxygalactose transaminase